MITTYKSKLNKHFFAHKDTLKKLRSIGEAVSSRMPWLVARGRGAKQTQRARNSVHYRLTSSLLSSDGTLLHYTDKKNNFTAMYFLVNPDFLPTRMIKP